MAKTKTGQQLTIENAKLQARLEEMEDSLEALRPSEARFRTLAEEMPHFVWETDENGRVLYANKRFYDYAGLTIEQAKAGGWLAVQHPDDAPAVEAAWLRALNGLNEYDMESRFLNASTGAYRWFRIKGSPVSDHSGRIIRWVGTCTDIDDTKRSEEALRESEHQLRQANELLETVTRETNVIIAAQDRNFHYTFFNKAYADEIRRLTGKELHIGCAMRELFAEMPEQLDIAMKEWRRPLGGETVSKTIEFGDPSRHRRFYSVLQTPLRNDEGAIIGAGEVALDITDRIMSEINLQRSEAKFRLLSDTATQLLATNAPQKLIDSLCRTVMEHLDCQAFFNFMVDERAGRLRLNACAGIPASEIQKLEWLDYGVAVCGCVARDEVRIIAEDIFHTPDARTELVRAFGIQAYCCHPLKVLDRIIGTLSFGTKTRARFSHDEVELMQSVSSLVAVAMQRLMEQQVIVDAKERLQLALDAGNMGTWEWDLQTNRVTGNSREFALLGLSALDGTIDAESFFRRVHPEDEPKLRAAMKDPTTRSASFLREFRIVQTDGRVRWLMSIGRLIHDPAGHPRSVIGISYDTTERRAAEESLRRSKNEMEEKVRERTTELVLLLNDVEKSRDDLRKLASELVMAEERERKRIAVTLHDDVAQTLAAAKMRLDFLKNIMACDESRNALNEACELIRQSIRETRGLMTEISNPILYDMGLPAAVQNLAEKMSAGNGLTVCHSVSGEFDHLNPEISVMMYQALRELLQNIIKHSQARNVTVRLTADDTGIRTIVSDDGQGFDADSVRVPGREGGFGLFSIRERVKSFHGDFAIESGKGTGTVITIVLPVEPHKEKEANKEQTQSTRRPKKKRERK